MAAAVFVGFVLTWNLEHLSNPPGPGGFPAHQDVSLWFAAGLALRAGVLLLFGGFLLARRNEMAKLSGRATAGVCVAWGLVTALDGLGGGTSLSSVFALLPVVVFVAVIATGVRARTGQARGLLPAAWATTRESVVCAWAVLRAVWWAPFDLLP
jgi:hypothetical protein